MSSSSISVCRTAAASRSSAEIRKHSPVPIIVLSARDDERSKVEALDLGADDYIGKPFGMAELMARLRAALRHRFPGAGRIAESSCPAICRSIWSRRHVSRAGQEIKLSPKEFELLRHLVAHAGKVLTHRHLLREVWGPAQSRGGAISPGVHPRSAAEARTRPDPPDPYPDRAWGRLSPAIAAGAARMTTRRHPNCCGKN